jgi:hypothetical protein
MSGYGDCLSLRAQWKYFVDNGFERTADDIADEMVAKGCGDPRRYPGLSVESEKLDWSDWVMDAACTQCWPTDL